MIEPEISILLATYNGERFIVQQIESIINQTYKYWQLYIRDDGSCDGTVDIVRSYVSSHERIHLVTDHCGNVGSCQNFSLLMKALKNDGEYVMYADQDDFWEKDKIEITLKEMISMEEIYGQNYPLLVHTNFTYADEDLHPIASKKNFQAAKIKHLKFVHLLAQNPVYGCTTMINRPLLDLVPFIPSAAENHDHWIALTAAAFGKIFYISKKTILYRQHDKNISTQHDNTSFLKRLDRLRNKKNFEDAELKVKMALAFKEAFLEKMTNEQIQVVNDFIRLPAKKNITAVWRNIRNGLRRQTILQTILFYYSLFFLKNIVED